MNRIRVYESDPLRRNFLHGEDLIGFNEVEVSDDELAELIRLRSEADKLQSMLREMERREDVGEYTAT